MAEPKGPPRSPFAPPSATGPSRPAWSPTTEAIVAGRPERAPDAPLNAAPVLASTFHAGGPIGYGRDGNPTWSALEEVIGVLEVGAALTFASGMAAVTALFDLVPVGGAVVVPRDGFYGTRAVLAGSVPGRFTVREVDIADTEATLAACADAELLFVESPTNPLNEVADIRALTAGARALGVRSAVDNTYLTPLGQRPLALGADAVVHSVTKLLAGHSDLVLGAIVTPTDSPLLAQLRRRRGQTGAIPGPMEAWLALRGVRTLPLRFERAQANAQELAARLAGHPAVSRVRYPGLPTDPWHARARAQSDGFGAMIAFEVHGGAGAAEALAGALRLVVHATSLGGIESSLERRAKWPGERVPPSLLRFSVGCESVEDIWADLEQALRMAARVAAADTDTAVGRPVTVRARPV
jgi:cystathionine gamma-synthase